MERDKETEDPRQQKHGRRFQLPTLCEHDTPLVYGIRKRPRRDLLRLQTVYPPHNVSLFLEHRNKREQEARILLFPHVFRVETGENPSAVAFAQQRTRFDPSTQRGFYLVHDLESLGKPIEPGARVEHSSRVSQGLERVLYDDGTRRGLHVLRMERRVSQIPGLLFVQPKDRSFRSGGKKRGVERRFSFGPPKKSLVEPEFRRKILRLRHEKKIIKNCFFLYLK